MQSFDWDILGKIERLKYYEPVPSGLPFCPIKKIFLSQKTEVETVVNEIFKESGNTIHAVIQERFASKFTCWGNWVCAECNQEAGMQTRPEHIHHLKYTEAKVPIPNHNRHCKPDMVIQVNGVWVLLEFKSTGWIPDDRPRREHWLQANLTTYAISQYLPISWFAVIYIDRGTPKYSKMSDYYAVDEKVAELCIELMNGTRKHGICNHRDQWKCEFTDTCFCGSQDLYLRGMAGEEKEKLNLLNWPTASGDTL
jgi:hypothetical protein